MKLRTNDVKPDLCRQAMGNLLRTLQNSKQYIERYIMHCTGCCSIICPYEALYRWFTNIYSSMHCRNTFYGGDPRIVHITSTSVAAPESILLYAVCSKPLRFLRMPCLEFQPRRPNTMGSCTFSIWNRKPTQTWSKTSASMLLHAGTSTISSKVLQEPLYPIMVSYFVFVFRVDPQSQQCPAHLAAKTHHNPSL